MTFEELKKYGKRDRISYQNAMLFAKSQNNPKIWQMQVHEVIGYHPYIIKPNLPIISFKPKTNNIIKCRRNFL